MGTVALGRPCCSVFLQCKSDCLTVVLCNVFVLGGIINVMPFLYTKIDPVREQVLNFRRSVTAGLLTCTLLNILWYWTFLLHDIFKELSFSNCCCRCWAVLDIVPQTSDCCESNMYYNVSLHQCVMILALYYHPKLGISYSCIVSFLALLHSSLPIVKMCLWKGKLYLFFFFGTGMCAKD